MSDSDRMRDDIRMPPPTTIPSPIPIHSNTATPSLSNWIIHTYRAGPPASLPSFKSLNPGICFYDDIAHVVGKEDPQERAKVFECESEFSDNAITLCQRCHKELDYASNFVWVFFPTDLGYFIMFEEEVRRRRPSLLPLGTEGGWRSILPRLVEAFYELQWYGALQASIRRAFAALGSVRISVLDPGIEQQLLQLRRLYFENIDGQDLVIEPSRPATHSINGTLKEIATQCKAPQSDDHNQCPTLCLTKPRQCPRTIMLRMAIPTQLIREGRRATDVYDNALASQNEDIQEANNEFNVRVKDL
ncbi:hypothetical protein N7494_001831 [Penicillium frequentans]|uniref:Uncharacterized protein n=1 Tax=Penicillium frequentans TaxID=3151616 RepID=A0AAD6D2H2_9EURO|nr:hypothetical protein N7494_001831 [Penicillium glabrum]